MKSVQYDLSVFNRFGFEIKPIGMQFLLKKPENVERLEGEFALCEMFKEAQEAERPFYTDFENHTCGGGISTLGLDVPETANWIGAHSAVASGRLGPKFKIFEHPVANRRTLLAGFRFEKHSVKYVLFSPLDRLSFDPDILLITARPRQAEIILRAYSYTSGVTWETKTTSIIGCAWLVAYPYLSGKLNYTPTGLGFGMRLYEVWPEGLIVLSIPHDLLPMITQNLQNMEWVLPSYKGSREDRIALGKEIHQALYSDMDPPS